MRLEVVRGARTQGQIPSQCTWELTCGRQVPIWCRSDLLGNWEGNSVLRETN